MERAAMDISLNGASVDDFFFLRKGDDVELRIESEGEMNAFSFEDEQLAELKEAVGRVAD